MKIAVISDIHGNLEALMAVLEDIKVRKIDKIYCIGDIIAKGSHPKECLDLIKQKCEQLLNYYAKKCGIKKINEIYKKKPHRGILR